MKIREIPAISGTMVIGMGFLVGATLIANASPQDQALPANPAYRAQPYHPAQPRYQAQPSYPLPGTPPGWSYDPYTNGTVPAPNRGGGP
jgi:hypothetical protein